MDRRNINIGHCIFPIQYGYKGSRKRSHLNVAGPAVEDVITRCVNKITAGSA
jgi:hypothetical protein